MHIEQLEYKVWRLWGELNKLRVSSNQTDYHLYQDRLNRLESELNYMQKEIMRMKTGQTNLTYHYVPAALSQSAYHCLSKIKQSESDNQNQKDT